MISLYFIIHMISSYDCPCFLEMFDCIGPTQRIDTPGYTDFSLPALLN